MLNDGMRTRGEDEIAVRLPPRLAAGPVAQPAAVAGPTLADEVAYLSGIDANGRITAASYWSAYAGTTAFKFGAPTAGTGATATYAFDVASGFSATEQATFERALAVWSSVANIGFVCTSATGSADILLTRGHDEGAYTTSPITRGSGVTLGQHSGQSVISIDTSVPGFDLSGSLQLAGGYGFATAMHEIGHAIGLGHGGAYNETYSGADQFSAYDTALFTAMSYFSWADTDLRYGASPFAGPVYWGYDAQGSANTSPRTPMTADILAAQALYGVPTSGPFTTPQTFGYHSTVTGPLAALYDFSQTTPIMTLYSRALGNTLDLGGTYDGFDNTVDLTPGSVSSVQGWSGNLVIAPGTWIDTCIGSPGRDTIVGNDHANRIEGGAGFDTLSGGGGSDQLSGGGGYDSDWLDGGAGDDTCFLANGYVQDTGDGGFDRVFASGTSCVVYGGVEVLAFSGAQDAEGDARDAATAITIYGNVGDDVLSGGHAGDTLLGGDGGDSLTGWDGDDRLQGGLGDDLLQGGFGADTLIGGGGSDRYYSVEEGDVVIERAGDDGIDQVFTALARYTLPDGVETLSRDGTTEAVLTGNALDNRITITGAAAALHGADGDDVLIGRFGSDRLDGGKGSDRMEGDYGDDRYLVDHAGDVVIEQRDRGHDTVVASIATTLVANVEDLVLTGRARAGTGNALDNAITGGKGADTLAGLVGNDVLSGGKGNDRLDGGVGDDVLTGGIGADVLTGGAGADRFVVAPGDSGAAARKADTIADFHHAEGDLIDLSAFAPDAALRFVGTRAFSGAAGEVHSAFVGGDTIVSGDLNGDTIVDFALTLAGQVALVRTDFMLAI